MINGNADTAFDLDHYLSISGATKPDLFDWTAPQPQLDDDALFALGYMMDIESHTVVYMRDLLSTRVIRDNTVTAFLSCWVYEEFFHSQLLRRFLTSQGVSIDDQRFADLRTHRLIRERMVRPMASLISRLTRHFPAVHMTWGALNELSTLTGYASLIEHTAGACSNSGSGRFDSSLLEQILRRIIKDERRHFAFYFGQARSRLRARGAQRLTSFLLRRFWAPVGSSVRGDAAARRICSTLFAHAAGLHRLKAIDSAIKRLPGLEWFDLAVRRCAPRPAGGAGLVGAGFTLTPPAVAGDQWPSL